MYVQEQCTTSNYRTFFSWWSTLSDSCFFFEVLVFSESLSADSDWLSAEVASDGVYGAPTFRTSFNAVGLSAAWSVTIKHCIIMLLKSTDKEYNLWILHHGVKQELKYSKLRFSTQYSTQISPTQNLIHAHTLRPLVYQPYSHTAMPTLLPRILPTVTPEPAGGLFNLCCDGRRRRVTARRVISVQVTALIVRLHLITSDRDCRSVGRIYKHDSSALGSVLVVCDPVKLHCSGLRCYYST